MLNPELINTTYTEIVKHDWSSFQGSVDGQILPCGRDWSNGTQDDPHILISFQYAIHNNVSKSIDYKYQRDELDLFVNPKTAGAMAASSEIRNYLYNDPNLLSEVRGTRASRNTVWGLSDRIYGVNIIVVDGVHVLDIDNSTLDYDMKSGEAYLVVTKAGNKSFIPGFKYTHCLGR